MSGLQTKNGSDSNTTQTTRSPNQDDKALTALFVGQMQFSLDFFKMVYNGSQSGVKSKSTSENIFFSPMSVYSALLLAYFGASNRTEDQLAQVLGFQDMDKVKQMPPFLLVGDVSWFLKHFFSMLFSYSLHAFFLV